MTRELNDWERAFLQRSERQKAARRERRNGILLAVVCALCGIALAYADLIWGWLR